MKFNYPKGHFEFSQDQSQQSNTKKMNQKSVNYGNRGMSLEASLNLTNEQYVSLG